MKAKKLIDDFKKAPKTEMVMVLPDHIFNHFFGDTVDEGVFIGARAFREIRLSAIEPRNDKDYVL